MVVGASVPVIGGRRQAPVDVGFNLGKLARCGGRECVHWR